MELMATQGLSQAIGPGEAIDSDIRAAGWDFQEEKVLRRALTC